MFDIGQSIFDEYGEIAEGKVEEYIDGFMEEFAAAPEAKPFLDSGTGVGWAATMMEYAVNYLGETPATMGIRDFNEVVFELFPRKVSIEPERAQAIVDELTAFWRFVQRQHGPKQAGKILETLGPSAAQRLQKELADPSNYGMAKSMFMMGQKAGFDMTTQEGLDQFRNAYNSQLLGSLPLPSLLPPEDEEFFPNLPHIGMSSNERAEKRKAKKRQRQARKRGRR